VQQEIKVQTRNEPIAKPRPVKFSHRSADVILTNLLSVCAPALIAFAKSRSKLPRASEKADQLGLSVLTRHYYSPLITPDDLLRPLNTPRNLPGVNLDLEVHREFISTFQYADELRQIPMQPGSATEFGYNNRFFETGDAEILYDVIRSFKPRRIIEVGSGWSTLIARKAIVRNQQEDAGYTCAHICIEPYEAPWLESVGVEVIRSRVETVDLTFFDQLEAGDILFVDSSHTIRPQGDVIFEIAEIYPRLKPGVLVQIHDIFTPRDYPRSWVVDDRRIWGEQYLLEAFLVGNGDYEIVCALNWMANDHRDLLAEACPVLCAGGEKQPGSFWMRRTAQPGANP
jgi:hypothetical protein